ncbi:MAG: hypothetical protein KDJ47_01385 [Hyphomicrobiaceae bacterium]|nr:hypothetical protein [Hyphomicrobiaceae bacterium]
MIDRYGKDALVEVDQRVTELKIRGQHEAEKLWMEIRETVRFLTSKSDNGPKH